MSYRPEIFTQNRVRGALQKMSTTGINQNYFSISKNLKYWFSDNFQFFMNTVLAISSKPFELQTSVFYTRQTILSSLRVIETKLDDRCTVWELWRHKHLADLIFSRNFYVEPFYQGQLYPWDYFHPQGSFRPFIVNPKWGRFFCTFNGFRENWIYMMKGPKFRFPPIWDPLFVWWPPPRNYQNSFLTF